MIKKINKSKKVHCFLSFIKNEKKNVQRKSKSIFEDVLTKKKTN